MFEGTNALGNPTSQEWTVISSATARTKYVIQCDPDLSIFSNIQLTATATHTYAEGVLTGTDVTLNIEDNGAPLELVDDWNIQLLYNNTAIRSYTAKPENGTLMKDVTNGWPYVPQGSTLSANIRLKTGETVELKSAVLKETSRPAFTTTVSGSTSYSVYKSSGADVANTKDGSSIFDINATATIAQEILGNQNYSSILKVAYTTDSGQNSGELSYGTVSQFNSLAWQKHVLTATVSFDGVNSPSSLDCHVTGLPYTLKHPANNYGWYTIEGSDIRYNDNSIHLETWSPTPTIGSPAFHIPETETLFFSLDCQYEKNTGSIGSYTFSVEMIKSSDHSRYGEICSHKSNKKGRYDLSGNGSFSSDINAVSCRYGYNAHGNSVSVISMQINYQ